jgi:alpha-L-fucosidase 2
MAKLEVIEWDLQTQYCHHGIPLSNGVFGALIWFEDNKIMITVNRADYWDHRGGMKYTEACKYERIKELLLQGEFDSIKSLFQPETVNGFPLLPTRLPMGRFEYKLKPGVQIKSARLHLAQGEAEVTITHEHSDVSFRFMIEMKENVLIGKLDSHLIEEVIVRPSDQFPRVKEYYDSRGFTPSSLMGQEGVTGWIQTLPEDKPVAVASSHTQDGLFITALYGDDSQDAWQQVIRLFKHLKQNAYEQAIEQTRTMWMKLWKRTPSIQLSHTELESSYYMGIYRMLGNTMPGKLAPTLQGPWAEEFRMIPWSGDYHFNINVQLMLLPAYAANHLESVENLFRMLEQWKPIMEERARCFVGIEDGYMVSHATDDRGQSIGGMWTGVIDHANTSWIAQMMWQYYRYTLNEAFLLQEVYPFMKRALNVFRQMLEWNGTSYSLPISVSPEFGGDKEGTWGQNSTFFLTNIHFLCEKMIWISDTFQLDEDYAIEVKQLKQRVPVYTTGTWSGLEYGEINPICNEELILWEGQGLSVSHRHHSHLAGIYPFDVMDCASEREQAIVHNTYRTWVDKGMGRWVGWSMPWASIIHTRLGKRDMALFCLNILREFFTMKGYGTRHNSLHEGFTTYHGGEIMQLDAAISASAAIMEMLVHSKRDILYVFAGIPDRIADASFEDIRAEGAFLISGTKKCGVIEQILIYSEMGAELKLANPFDGKMMIKRSSQTEQFEDQVLVLTTVKGETITITRG